MTTATLTCPHCHATLRVPAGLPGASGRCPACGGRVDLEPPPGDVLVIDLAVGLDDAGRAPGASRTRRRSGRGRTSRGMGPAGLAATLLAVGAILFWVQDGRDHWPVPVRVALAGSLWAGFLAGPPFLVPAWMARRGVLGPGRWALAAPLCLFASAVMFGLTAYFFAGLGARGLDVPGLRDAANLATAWTFLATGGCLLAAVVHRPARR